MDLNSIAAFIDLVKHPEKFEKELKRLIEHKQAVEESIKHAEAVSDIAAGKKQAKAELEKARSIKEKAIKEAAELQEKTVVALKAEEARLQNKDNSVTDKEQILSVLDKELSNKASTLAEKENELSAKEAHLVNWSARLAVQQQEIDERLEKLRGVMG